MQRFFFAFFIVIISGFSSKIPTKPFSITYLGKIQITGNHNDELPQYIVNLKCKIDGKLVYSDSVNDFEFQKRIWPSAKQIGANKYQLLLELNDRPDKNKIVLLTIQGATLLSKKVLPTFDSSYNASDGTKMFFGELEYSEALENSSHKTQYIPTLFYADKNNGFQLDTLKTIAFNKNKWGKFYGFQPNCKLILIPKKAANPLL